MDSVVLILCVYVMLVLYFFVVGTCSPGSAQLMIILLMVRFLVRCLHAAPKEDRIMYRSLFHSLYSSLLCLLELVATY